MEKMQRKLKNKGIRWFENKEEHIFLLIKSLTTQCGTVQNPKGSRCVFFLARSTPLHKSNNNNNSNNNTSTTTSTITTVLWCNGAQYVVDAHHYQHSQPHISAHCQVSYVTQAGGPSLHRLLSGNQVVSQGATGVSANHKVIAGVSRNSPTVAGKTQHKFGILKFVTQMKFQTSSQELASAARRWRTLCRWLYVVSSGLLRIFLCSFAAGQFDQCGFGIKIAVLSTYSAFLLSINFFATQHIITKQSLRNKNVALSN